MQFVKNLLGLQAVKFITVWGCKNFLRLQVKNIY